MPELTPYTLQFKGGLHVGTRGVNLEEAGVSIPSDSLFAAILSTLRLSGEDAQAFADAYVADPPFLLTSAFPYAGGVRFYPMPADAARLFGKDTVAKFGKKLGKVAWFSEGLLKEALKKGNLEAWLFPDSDTETPKTGARLQGNTLWLKVDEIASLPPGIQHDFVREEKKRHALARQTIWKAMRVPRVTIDRHTSATNIFHAGKVEFAAGCGLWFGVHWRKPEAEYAGKKFKAALEMALKMMQDDGVGGERTTGYGAFSLVDGISPITFADAVQPDGLAYLLSRYHPQGDEAMQALNDPHSAYRLTPVAGWLHTYDGASQRRKRVFLVEEGGLIRMGQGALGDVVDVRPEYNGVFGVAHPVYRMGLALALAWPSEGGAHA